MSKFIVIEGTDAAGKATQSKRLAARLERSGCEVLLLSFPRYETPLGKAILRHLKGEISVTQPEFPDTPGDGVIAAPEDALIFQTMMTADKLDATTQITDALSRGAYVIADRWWPSAYAYGVADGVDPDWLIRLHEFLLQPDLMLFLDVTSEEALRRRPQARDRYERDRTKQELVRQNYHVLWSKMDYLRNGRSDEEWIVVDGGATEDKVAEAIWTLLVSQEARRRGA